MDEREAKRKREEDSEEEDATSVPPESRRKLPKLDKESSLQRVASQQKGTQKDNEKTAAEKAAKRRAKRDKAKAKKESRAAEAKARKAEKKLDAAESIVTSEPQREANQVGLDEMNEVDFDGLEEEEGHSTCSTVTPSPSSRSPFDPLHDPSGCSSISSIAPPALTEDVALEQPLSQQQTVDTTTVDDTSKLPEIDPEALRARFNQRMEELRAARKADGVDGKPARSRQELIEARRRKEEQRKAHKKEQRKKAIEEERKHQADLIARGSPLLSPAVLSPGSPSKNFAFGRIAFPNGQHASADLSTLRNAPKHKGAQDPQTALQAAQNKEKRLASFDADKRDDISEKDLWLNSMKRAQGERVRDDSSLLKKALKRKERQKRRSEEKWDERLESVRKGQEIRQQKRENNLAKRKEEKGKGSVKVKGGKPKKKARPGFEGSFRARAR